jgi:hypothetical protein
VVKLEVLLLESLEFKLVAGLPHMVALAWIEKLSKEKGIVVSKENVEGWFGLFLFCLVLVLFWFLCFVWLVRFVLYFLVLFLFCCGVVCFVIFCFFVSFCCFVFVFIVFFLL